MSQRQEIFIAESISELPSNGSTREAFADRLCDCGYCCAPS
jgi:hypothetical protein